MYIIKSDLLEGNTEIWIDNILTNDEKFSELKNKSFRDIVDLIPLILAENANDDVTIKFIGQKDEFKDLKEACVNYEKTGQYKITLNKFMRNIDIEMKTKKEFIDYLDSLQKEIEDIGYDDLEILSLKQSIQSQELLIPVVGAFSAGKSSLVNAFLDEDILPVGITPETSLATEIRYDSNPRIEAVKSDDNFDTFLIDEIGSLAKAAKEYKYMRLFLSNQYIESIEPLILVDMPGFESPYDMHNRAIMEYLDKGVHYIVLTSVEDGTITRSMTTQLQDIMSYKRDLSFFLTKVDLRSNDETIEIKKQLEVIIEEDLGIEKQVIPIDINSSRKSLEQIISGIDPNKLFEELFIDTFKDNFHSIKSHINTLITSLSRSKEENEEAIDELNRGLKEVIAKRDQLLDEAKEKYSDIRVGNIIENIGKEITSNTDELINTIINSGIDGFNARLSEIIRHTLISSVNSSMDEIGEEIIQALSSSLESAESQKFGLDDKLIEKISQNTKDMLGRLQDVTGNLSINKKTAIYKVITTVLAVTTTVVAPIIEIIIIFLPELIGGIFKSFQEKKQQEAYRNVLLTQIVPSVKSKLREMLPKLFDEQVRGLIESISAKYEDEISKKREAIIVAEDEIKSKIADTEIEISRLDNKRATITTLATSTLYK